MRLSLPVLRQDPVPILLNTLESFTTLRRRVEVYFHHIRIHDDGDIDLFGEDDDGEAKFWLSVMEGKTLVNAFSWGLGDVSDKEGKNTVLFDPPLKYVLGPKSVTFDRRSVGVNIQGLEDDNTGDEYAVSAPNIHAFEVPVGRGKEQVPLMSEDVAAVPVPNTNSSLQFTVKVSHTIDYVA